MRARTRARARAASLLRRTRLLLPLLAAAVACAPPPSRPVVLADPVRAAAIDHVRAVRALLGPPTVTLADALIGLSRDLDDLRHTVPRGAAMAAGAEALDRTVADLRAAAQQARQAAQDLPGVKATRGQLGVAARRAGTAEEIVGRLAGTADRAAAAATAEIGALRAYAALDQAMDAVAGEWDTAGSQSARRAALTALADRARALRGEAEALPVVPPDCTGMRDRRVGWADLLVERTQTLAGLATGEGGTDYDALRDRYRRAPYGEDRAAADASGRGCWESASPVPAAAEQAAAAADELRAALSGL